MFKVFSNPKLKAFGLDISDVSIKVAQLEKIKNAVTVHAIADAPLADNVIANHLIINEDRLADNIKKAVASAKNINTSYVVASIPESKSFVRVLKIPKMSESEISGALPFELEQNIPVPINLVYMDWQILRETQDNLEVLVTATPKDYTDTFVSSLKKAGLRPVALEIESQAMARSLVGQSEKDTAVLIVDISSLQTSFVVVEKGSVEYTSSIPLAGSAFTESIARNLGLPSTEAEKAKKEQGLIADIKRGNIRQAILPLLDNIVDEIKNVAKFHEEHSETKVNISKIILCGGSAKLPGIADYISARLNLGASHNIGEVVLGNPWVNATGLVKPPFDPIESLSFATALGLALRGMDL